MHTLIHTFSCNSCTEPSAIYTNSEKKKICFYLFNSHRFFFCPSSSSWDDCYPQVSRVSRVCCPNFFLPLIFVSLYFCSCDFFSAWSSQPLISVSTATVPFSSSSAELLSLKIMIFSPRKAFLCCNWISLSAVIIFYLNCPLSPLALVFHQWLPLLSIWSVPSSLWLLGPSLRIFPLSTCWDLKPAAGCLEVRSPESRDVIVVLPPGS